MLARRLRAFAAVPFSRGGAVVCILRAALKSLYEELRALTFDSRGLQQIQLECAALNTFISGFIDSAEDGGSLCSLVSECLESATQRCRNPQLADPTVIETIIDASKT